MPGSINGLLFALLKNPLYDLPFRPRTPMTFHLDEFAPLFIWKDNIQKYTFSQLKISFAAQKGAECGGKPKNDESAVEPSYARWTQVVPVTTRSELLSKRCCSVHSSANAASRGKDFWQQLGSPMQITNSQKDGHTHTCSQCITLLTS